MGHALINLTSLLDRKIHQGWHKLVGEATDISETSPSRPRRRGRAHSAVVPLAGDSGKQVVPPQHRSPPSRHRQASAPASRAARRKSILRGAARAWPRRRARARRRAAARAVPELAEIEKDAAPAVTTEEDDDVAAGDLVEDYTYVNPFDVHRFWNREVFVTPPGAVPRPFPSQLPRRRRRDGVESVSRAQASSARGGS